MLLPKVITLLDDTYGPHYSGMRILQFLVGSLLMCHWLACAFHAIVMIEDKDDNWVSGYFKVESRHDVSLGTRFVTSWYWSVMTTTTIGYGDVLAVTASERVVATVGMLIGASVYAFILGNITSLVSAMNMQQQALPPTGPHPGRRLAFVSSHPCMDLAGILSPTRLPDRVHGGSTPAPPATSAASAVLPQPIPAGSDDGLEPGH